MSTPDRPDAAMAGAGRPTRGATSPRLASRVLSHVLLPLAATWLVGTAVTVGVANHHTQQAFDRALLDDAWSVAANVRPRGTSPGSPQLDLLLTPREVSAVLFDAAESIYFAVLYPDGALVAGHPGLHAPPLADGRSSGFFDIVYQGRPLRAVRLALREPVRFDVVMAQTTNSRRALLARLLLYTMLPQALLLLLLAVWLRRAVARELAPLSQLHQAVDRRDANDLAPLPVAAGTREIERLTGALNSLLERVAASVRAQREFSGNVAHELRTPLAGIRAQADYALARDDPAVWREQLQGIVRSEARASHQIDQLLLLAIGDEARSRLELVELRLDELVRETLLRFVPRAIAQGVDLGADGLDEPVTVRANAGLVEGLLSNLIDNALRHGSSATAPHVTVSLSRSARGRVRIDVCDNGAGLTAPQRVRVMQRGERGACGPGGQRPGPGPGAGLGLAIVVRYAELLGARFSLDDGADGRGLCAAVEFPEKTATATTADPPSGRPVSGYGAGSVS